jgi:hypothetical protein
MNEVQFVVGIGMILVGAEMTCAAVFWYLGWSNHDIYQSMCLLGATTMSIDDSQRIYERRYTCRRCFKGECAVVMKTTIAELILLKPNVCLIGGSSDVRWEPDKISGEI